MDIDSERIETDIGPLIVRRDDTALASEIRAAEAFDGGLPGCIRSILRPGMTAIDVGAGVGYFSRLMAREVGRRGRVVALEPDPASAELLQVNAESSKGAPIEIIQPAVWPARYRLGPSAASEQTTEGASAHASAVNESPAASGLVDDRLPSAAALIRLGPDISTHAWLRDARRLLDRSRPIVLVSFSPERLRQAEVDPVSVLDRYRAMGFRPSGIERKLPADPSVLVRQLDAEAVATTTLRLDPVDSAAPAAERLLPGGRRLGRTWARRFPASPEPRTLAYDATHRALVSSLLDSHSWLSRFASGAQLPPGLGAGFDERVVEYPWLFSRGPSGRVLDAGSVLNHRHVIERLLPAIDDLTIVTLAPEAVAFTELGVSYLYADMRALPLRDGWFDEVVCLSTLEHVGMDNAVYGAAGHVSTDPGTEAAKALGELMRVVRPGGRIHISVPFGRREDHGWLRQLNADDFNDLLAGAGVTRYEEVVFRHTPAGWRRTTTRKAAGARYNDSPQRGAGGTVAAEAVVCATIFA